MKNLINRQPKNNSHDDLRWIKSGSFKIKNELSQNPLRTDLMWLRVTRDQMTELGFEPNFLKQSTYQNIILKLSMLMLLSLSVYALLQY